MWSRTGDNNFSSGSQTAVGKGGMVTGLLVGFALNNGSFAV